MSQVKAVEQMLHFESSEQINATFTKEDLQTAAELFLYLDMCPDTMKPWILFYKDTFLNQSPDQIILSLNRLIKGKSTAQTQHFAKIAGTLFRSIKMKIFPEANITFCLFE